jgi:hypothetical protein
MPTHMESVEILGCEKRVCHVYSPLLGISNFSGVLVEVYVDGRTRAWTRGSIARRELGS